MEGRKMALRCVLNSGIDAASGSLSGCDSGLLPTGKAVLLTARGPVLELGKACNLGQEKVLN